MNYYRKHYDDGNISASLYGLIKSTCGNTALWEENARKYLTFKERFYEFGKLSDLLYIARGYWGSTEISKKIHRAIITNQTRNNFYKTKANGIVNLSMVTVDNLTSKFFDRNIIDALIEKALLKEGFTVYRILSTGSKIFSKYDKVFYVSPLNPFLIDCDSLYRLVIDQGWMVLDFSVNDLDIIDNLKTYGCDPNVIKKQVTIHI